MCGFVGFTGPIPGASAHTILAAMMQPIGHRGPDGRGLHVDEAVALGHLRLAIIDLAGGSQPRVDQESRSALAFNGEIYGYMALADRLRTDGVILQDRSDTEVLFQLIRQHGVVGALKQIDGMFAFAFSDGTGRVWLARDRFGEKPLFYGIRNGTLAFASELRALRKHPLFLSSDVDTDALSGYLTLQYLPNGATGFKDIYKLPPGTVLCFENGQIRLEQYWHPILTDTAAAMPAEERLDRLEALFSESVRDRLVADVPIGIFLSGGLDSALVAAYARFHAPNVTAYSVRMAEESFDETPQARETAAALGMRHEVIALDSGDLLSAFDTVMDKLDEPMADASLIPTYLLCRTARKSVTVAIGGDGADELFAGYPNFKARRLAGIMAKIPEAVGSVVRAGIDALPAANGYMSLPFKIRQLTYGFGLPPDEQTHYWMAAFSPDEQRSLWSCDSAPASPSRHLRQLVRDQLADCDSRDGLRRLQHMFLNGYLAEDILTKVDRASMYSSLEVRAPFLGKAFAEFAMSLPNSDKLDGTVTKAILRKMAAKHFPAHIINRPKHGFAPPLASLLRGALRDRAEAILMDQTAHSAMLFNRDSIRTLWTEHVSGKRDHHRKLWTLMVLNKALSD